MLIYVVRRLALALVTCAAISVLTFVIIRLPPGDFVDAYIANLAVGGSSVSAEQAASMRREYGAGSRRTERGCTRQRSGVGSRVSRSCAGRCPPSRHATSCVAVEVLATPLGSAHPLRPRVVRPATRSHR